jgi:histidinol phosphatase-like PHP family hydrolase
MSLCPVALQAGSDAAVAPPRVDLHVHLSDEMTLVKLAQRSRETNCEFGIVEHPGPRYSPMTDERSLNAYLDQLVHYGFFKGVQPVDPGWRKMFSKEALARLDYVLMDALEIPDNKDGHAIIWKDDFRVDDADAFMARYVDFYLQVLADERPNILASPTFLPKCLRERYEELWTEERMETIIKAAIRSGVALEINSMYRIPSQRFVARAKRMGALFSFGTNGRTAAIIGKLDYSFEIAKRCNLVSDDIYIPNIRNRSAPGTSLKN